MRVVELSMYGSFPTQFEGVTDDNEPIYIRYRYGRLSMHLGNPNETVYQMLDRDWDGTEVFSRDDGTGDGIMSFQELRETIPECWLIKERR